MTVTAIGVVAELYLDKMHWTIHRIFPRTKWNEQQHPQQNANIEKKMEFVLRRGHILYRTVGEGVLSPCVSMNWFYSTKVVCVWYVNWGEIFSIIALHHHHNRHRCDDGFALVVSWLDLRSFLYIAIIYVSCAIQFNRTFFAFISVGLFLFSFICYVMRWNVQYYKYILYIWSHDRNGMFLQCLVGSVEISLWHDI